MCRLIYEAVKFQASRLGNSVYGASNIPVASGATKKVILCGWVVMGVSVDNRRIKFDQTLTLLQVPSGDSRLQ